MFITVFTNYTYLCEDNSPHQCQNNIIAERTKAPWLMCAPLLVSSPCCNKKSCPLMWSAGDKMLRFTYSVLYELS